MGINLFETGKLADQIHQRTKRMMPWHQRMDKWLAMYLLYDPWQDNKPLGERRFISNDPMSIIDTAERVISRFPLQWRLPTDQYAAENEERQRLYGQLERVLYGFMEDIDEDLTDRGEMIARKWVAKQLLLRGCAVTKTHVTSEAGRDSNLVHANYDSRFVLPTYDKFGLESIICLTPMDGEELMYEYPEKFKGDEFQSDQSCVKVEVWDKVKMGVTFTIGRRAYGDAGSKWCIEPTEHGFFDEDGKPSKKTLNKLPFVITKVNGVAIREKVIGPFRYNTPDGKPTPQTIKNMLSGNAQQPWRTQPRAVSEMGRSILASIEAHAPLFNEAVASIWQGFSRDSYGVYFMQSRGAQVPEEAQQAIGGGGIIGMERGDTVQRFNPQTVNEATIRFATIIEQEKQKSTIDPVLQAQGNFNSGFQQARAEQVALNSLEPWAEGQSSHFSRIGQLIVDQVSNGQLSNKVTLGYRRESQSGSRDFFQVEFDPSVLKGLPRIVVKADVEPALPVDMMERATIASTLVNGRRPLISRSTAQERILRIPDPVRENERIWEDVAETDSVVILDEIAAAAERNGNAEVAKLFRDRQAQALIMEAAQRMIIQQQMSNMGANMLAQNNQSNPRGVGRGDVYGPDQGAPNPPPEQQSPEMRNEGRENGGGTP